MNNEALVSVYMFIAELLGYKPKTKLGKIKLGIKAYLNNELTDSIEERIWLERLYAELTKYKLAQAAGVADKFHWSVPIELDASASMLGFIGCLLGDKRLLEMTNIAGEGLNDPWYVEGLSREHVKRAATPMLYGSGKTPAELWKNNKLEYSLDDIKTINDELKHGALGLANQFKEFILSYVKPKDEMEVVIGDDKFTIKCNHYKQVGELTVAYDLYDTDTKRIRRIHHTKTKAVPDLDRFKRYFVTLLVHNLDGQVASRVAEKCMDKYGFCLDIHDAFVVSPIAAADVRKWYAEELDTIYANRKEILQNYFVSVGMGSEAVSAWHALMDKVVPVEDGFKARVDVLK